MPWAPDYITVSELSDYLSLTTNDDDTYLSLAASAASRAVDRRCGRQFGTTTSAVERHYQAEYDRHAGVVVVETDDIAAAAGLVVSVDGVEVGADYYRLMPRNAASRGQPWTSLELDASLRSGTAEVSVTAVYGWTAVPEPVRLATMLQAARFQARRQSVFGVAAGPGDGTDVMLRAALDPDVYVMVKPYARGVWAR